jgi:uncharacterized BrkB/YihY/UPF0761 family membrane protein
MRHPGRVRNDYTHQTPAAVTGSVACGVAPLPLLAVYTVIFLIHGSIKPVHPPDVTSTTHGEFVAGLVSLVLLIALVFCLLWFLNGKRRWPLAVMELASLVVFFDFMIDSTKGGPIIPALLVLTSIVSLVLMFAPASWWWLDRKAPAWIETVTRVVLRRLAAPVEPAEAEETVVFAADEIVLDEPVAENPAAV